MAKYKFDPLNYKNTFNNMFGPDAYDTGISRARELGGQIGQAKLMRQALIEAAKEKKKKEEKEKDDKSKKAKENENLERRIEASGGSTEKEQSAVGKALGLDPDNNLFFDALDLLGRPVNAVMNVGKREEERKKGKSEKDKYIEEMRSKPIWETGIDGKWDVIKDQANAAWKGFKGDDKTFGSDVLEEAGMEEGIGRTALGFGLDVAVDPLNLAGGAIAKGAGAVAKGSGKLANKIPGVERVANAVGDAFSTKRAMKRTLDPKKTSENLARTNEQLQALRSELVDKSLTDISKARLAAGSDVGAVVGKIMEEPLRKAQPLDISKAPNVLQSQKALSDMEKIYQKSIDPLAPIARTGALETSTTASSKINIPEPTDKEVRAWLKKNDLPGGEKKGRVSTFNKNLYKAENEQALRASYQVETKVQNVLSSTTDIDRAAQTLSKDPVIQRNVRQAAKILTESNKELVDFMRINDIKDIKEIEGYMTHFATKEAQKYLKEHGDYISSGAAKVGGDEKVMTRKIQDNVSNANKIMKKKTGVDEFFTTDAFTATAGGQHKVVNYIVAEMAKKQVLGNAEVARVIPSGSKARRGYVKMDINGKSYEMTRGAADVIRRYDDAVSDEGIRKFLNVYDKAMSTWKKGALFSAGYHARNVIGNTFNMSISEMSAPAAMAKQTQSMAYLGKLKSFRNGRTTELKGVPEKVAQQYDEFVSTGLRATGVGADFADETAEKAMSEIRYRGKGAGGKALHEFSEIGQAQGAGGKLAQTLNSPFETSRRLGDEADEVARFTLYRHLRDKGMSVEKATNRVKEVLYDYNDLTTIEREIFKRFAPFYTFTRKNLEFQLKNFAKNPQKYNRLNMLIQEAYNDTGMDQSIVPDYLKDSLAIPIPGTNQLLNAALPASDLARITDPLKMGVDMLSPLPKTLIESAMNTKMYNGAKIEEYDGQEGSILGMPVGKKWEYAFQSAFTPLRNLAGAQQQMDDGETGINPLLKAVGGQLNKPYDEEAFQLQADYKENDRLQGIKKKMEREEGKEVMTIQDMKDAGIPTNDIEDFEKALFDKYGFAPVHREMFLNMKKKAADPVAAKQIRAMLESRGLPDELVDYISTY